LLGESKVSSARDAPIAGSSGFRGDRRVPYAGTNRIRFKGIPAQGGISAVLSQHPQRFAECMIARSDADVNLRRESGWNSPEWMEVQMKPVRMNLHYS